MNKHIRLTCKIYQIHEETKKEELFDKLVKELEEKDKLLKKQNKELHRKDKTINKLTINNTTNNNYNTTINNNYTLNAFGKEDLSYIKDSDYLKLFESSHEAVLNLVKLIHFNKKQPHNANVYISNRKDNYVMVYNGTKWNVSMKNDTIDDIYDTKFNILDDKFDEIEDKIPEKSKKKFDRFLENSKSTCLQPKIKKRIKLELYNSKDLPMNNHKTVNY
jgi:hypothetical protein